MTVATVSQKLNLLIKLFGPADVDRSGINAQFWCPFCKHPNSKKRKLAIRLEDGVTHCWVCGWSARSVTRLALLLNMKQAILELVDLYGEISLGAAPIEEETLPAHVELPKDFKLLGKLLDVDGSRDPDHVACLRYLASRSVDVSTTWAFRLGVSDERAFRRRIIFPSFDANGELNYVTARTIDDYLLKYKYINSNNDRKSVVFNEIDIDWSRELTLVEGPFDLLSCGGINATAMLGSWMDMSYLLMERIVLNRTPIVLALDPDAVDKQRKIASVLLKYGIPVRELLWDGCAAESDPAKIGNKEFKKLVKSARAITRDDVMKAKLSRALDSHKLV